MIKKRIVIVIMMIMLTIMTGCGSANKSVSDNETTKSKDEIYMKDAVIVDEEKELGAYKFTLEKVFYDDATNSGYVQMKITSDKKDVNKLKSEIRLYDKLIDDKNTYIVLDGCFDHRFRYEYSYNEINLYGFFMDKDNILNGKFYVTDSETGEKIEFILPDCKASDCYLYDDAEIWISPMTIYLKDYNVEKIHSLALVFKNGDRIDVIKDGNLYETAISSCSGNTDTGIYQSYIFLNNYIDFSNEAVDYEEVDYEDIKFEKINYEEIDYENIDYLEIDNRKIERKN